MDLYKNTRVLDMNVEKCICKDILGEGLNPDTP